MNQHQLKYFIEVYCCQNIQKAANQLFVSRQGVSKVIRSLEEELGQHLFFRTSSGVSPTDFAIALYPHALKLLDEYNYIEGMNTLSSQNKGLLKIYALDHVFSYLSVDFIIDFSKACPDVTLSIVDTTDDGALEGLLAQKCDLAIVNGPMDFTQFQGETLFYSRFCIRINKNHPLAAKKTLTFADLDGESIAGKGRSYRCFRKNIDKYMLLPGYKVNIVAETSDESILTELVQRNQAIVIGYDYSSVISPEKDIVMRSIDIPEDGEYIYLIERRDSPSTHASQIFKTFLTDWIQIHHKDQVNWGD